MKSFTFRLPLPCTSVPVFLAYSTEETEIVEVQRLAGELGGDMELAIRQLAEGIR